MKIFSFCNQKGGVGKTTTAVNLATSIAQSGKKTLLIDLDPQANASSGLGIDRSERKNSYDLILGNAKASEIIMPTSIENLSIIPSDSALSGAEVELISEAGREFFLRNAVKEIVDRFDYILIDCPPSLGLLTLNALVASDAMMVPLQCEYYALEGLSQLIKTHQLVKQRLKPELELSGVIMTMADSRTNLTNQVIDEVRSHFGDIVFKTVIPRSVKISEAPSFGKPVVIYDANSKGAQSYRKVAQEFLERFGTSSQTPEMAEQITQNP